MMQAIGMPINVRGTDNHIFGLMQYNGGEVYVLIFKPNEDGDHPSMRVSHVDIYYIAPGIHKTIDNKLKAFQWNICSRSAVREMIQRIIEPDAEPDDIPDPMNIHTLEIKP